MKRVRGRGIWAEFGVGGGKSASYILEGMLPDETLWLFDSWKGLPKEWQIREDLTLPKGAIAREQPDLQDPRCRYVKGWFDDTVDDVVASWESAVSFVHIDCDLFESTETVLQALQSIIFEGTVFVFDEMHGYPFWRRGEWRAWRRCCDMNGFKYEWIAREAGGRDALSAGLVII